MIPSGWREVKISDFAIDLKNGASIKPKDFSDNGIKVIHKGDVEYRGKLNLQDRQSRYVRDELKERFRLSIINENYLVVSLRDLVPAAPQLGLICRLDSSEEALLAQGTYAFKVREEIIHNEYLVQLSNCNWYRKLIRKHCVGSTQVHLRSSEFFNFELQLPPIKEQIKIAELLSTWDKAIDLLEATLKLKTDQKKWIIESTFSNDRMNKWKEVDLSTVVDSSDRYSFTGGPFGSDLKASDYTPEGVRIIQLQNIGDGEFNNKYKIFTSESKADQLHSCNIFPGEIIISKMGDPVARATLIPDHHERYVMASDGIRVKVDEARFNKHFILEAINSPAFRMKAMAVSTGSTRMRIGLTELKRIKFFVPEDVLQQNKYANLFVSINQEVQLIKSRIELIKKQKSGLMEELLTGRKRVKV